MAVRGLGKGLGALLGDVGQTSEQIFRDATTINVDSLRPNRYQPRKYFSAESLEELAASIKAQGVLQPIIVRPGDVEGKYELVAGERRWRATKLAGMQQIPAIVRELSNQECLALALIENVQRDDLNALEQARALHQLQVEFKSTQNDLAERTGLSRSHIANLLRLLQLPDELQNDIQNAIYSAGHGRVLAGITDFSSQRVLRDKIVAEDLSVRESEGQAAFWREHGRFSFQHLPKEQKANSAISERMTRYESMIENLIGLRKVRFRGTEEKGTVTMLYGSKDELHLLLDKLGIGEV